MFWLHWSRIPLALQPRCRNGFRNSTVVVERRLTGRMPCAPTGKRDVVKLDDNIRRRYSGAGAFLLLLIIVLSGLSPAAAQGPDDWYIPYAPAMLPDFAGDMLAHTNAPRYEMQMQLAVEPTRATLTGTQRVIFTNQETVPLDAVVFRLYPNLESYGGAMGVRDVTVDGVAITPQVDETASVLRLPLMPPLVPGAQIEITMGFEVSVRAGDVRLYGQFSYLDGVLSLPQAYPVLSVFKPGSGWWTTTQQPQGDIAFSPTAFYDVTVTAPTDLILTTSGTEIDTIPTGDGELKHHYVAPLMRDFALMASREFVTLGGAQDGTQITLFYNPGLPGAEMGAHAGLAMAQDALRIFNETFGRYPYAELDIVQTRTSIGGLEYPGLVVLNSASWQADDPLFAFLLVHEIAHQWWYGLVGNDQAQHPWLDEGLAQYAVALYIRAQEGEDAYRAAIESFRTQHATFVAADHPDQLIGDPVTAYPGLAYFYTIYQKAPLFYAALEDAYGSGPLLASLRNYHVAYRYGIATPAELRASLEGTLGVSLEALWFAWVMPGAVG